MALFNHKSTEDPYLHTHLRQDIYITPPNNDSVGYLLSVIPTIDSLSSNQAYPSGGNIITVTGRGFNANDCSQNVLELV